MTSEPGPGPWSQSLPMIDSHCHLAGEEFVDDLPAVVARAQAAGVTRALVILAAEQDDEWARARRWPRRGRRCGSPSASTRIRRTCSPPTRPPPARPWRARLDGTPLVQAIGEIGLDYHYDFSPRDVQQAVFRAQLGAGSGPRAAGGDPHPRGRGRYPARSSPRRRPAGPLAGVFHCFTGDPAVARAGARHRVLPVVCRDPHLPAGRRTARGRAHRARSIACWSKPTRRIWRRCRIAASATSRRGSRRRSPPSPPRATCRWRRWQPPCATTTTACSHGPANRAAARTKRSAPR